MFHFLNTIRNKALSLDALHQCMVLLLLWTGSSIAAALASNVVFQLFMPNLLTQQAVMNNKPAMSALLLIQSLGMFAIPALGGRWILYKKPWQIYRTNKVHYQSWFVAILLIVVSIPLIQWSAFVNSHLPYPESWSWIHRKMMDQELESLRTIKKIISTDSFWGIFQSVLYMAILPSLLEEWFFRGTLQPILARLFNNTHWGILITAILFSALHTQFLTFFPRVLLGMILGYLFVYGNSLWLPILAHFVNNSIAIVSFIFYNKQDVLTESVVQQMAPPILLSTSSAITVFYLIYRMRKFHFTNP